MIVLLVYISCLDDTGHTESVRWVLAAPAVLSVGLHLVGASLEPSSPDTQALDSLYSITFIYCGSIVASNSFRHLAFPG